MLSSLVALVLAQQDWKSDPVEVILHRSAGMAFPENTIPALEEAVRQGADGVEIDIRSTVDGHFVLFHDDWLPDSLGPGVKIDELTLAEARKLDVGSRWGSEFKGLQVPRLEDVFAFAKSNDLLLFLDIKTKNIDERLKPLIQKFGVQNLVIVPDRLAGDRPKLPFIDHWNYLDGGEEDPARMMAVIDKLQGKPARIMVDDARTVAHALKRKPARRPFVPFRETPDPDSPTIPADLGSKHLAELRRGLWAQSQSPKAESWPLVRKLALKHSDPNVRLDAIQALGRDSSTESKKTLDQILAEPLAVDPANHPSGQPYFDTFRLAAVAVAYARRNDQTELLAMARGTGFSPAAASLGATVHGSSDLIQKVLTVTPDGSGIPFAIAYAGARKDAETLYLHAMAKGDGYTRRIAVFNLARLSARDPDVLRRLRALSDEKIRQAVPLVAAWSDGTWPNLVPMNVPPRP